MVNVVGTYAVSKAFLPLLRKGTNKTIVNISSDAGCHAQNASFIHDDKPSEGGVGLSYRTSKAALNMGEALSCNLQGLSAPTDVSMFKDCFCYSCCTGHLCKAA